MKIKVNEASGPALDWMVAKCEGVKVEKIMGLSLWSSANWHRYSTDWAQGGPIIGREEICTKRQLPCSTGCEWNAWIWTKHIAKGGSSAGGSGPTLLITAMRCYVASKLGDEVEVPDELIDEPRTCPTCGEDGGTSCGAINCGY